MRYDRMCYFLLENKDFFAYKSDSAYAHNPNYIVYEVNTSAIKGYMDSKFQYESHSWDDDYFLKASEVMGLL